MSKVLRVLAPLGVALVLFVVLALGLQMTVSAEPTAQAQTCPWFGQSDDPNPTWEDWGGWYIVNGLPGPVGSEIEMRNTLGNAVSCYRTITPGGWGVSRITNGSQGFYVDEAISVFADNWPAQSGFHNYVGDQLGHSMTVTLDIPAFSLTLDPPVISQTVGVGEFKMIEVTVTNNTWYPAYFSSLAANGWDWSNMCVGPTTRAQNILKPNSSMVLLFSINGTTCANTGGFNSAFVLAETHPVIAGSPVSMTLPIHVAVAEMTPTATPMEATATPIVPTATPMEPTLTPVPQTATPVEPTMTPVPPTATPMEPTLTPVPPTATPVEPTLTPVPPTATPMEATATPIVPTATPMEPTLTPVPPTATPMEPTLTPVPPTATSLPPTATPVEPTFTPVPPTATPMEPTVTPAEWQVRVQSPGSVVGGETINFSITITNAGWENQLGKVEMFLSLSPFKLIPNVGISTGSLVGVSVSDKLMKYTWEVELLPGTVATLTSIGTAVEVATPWLYEGVWSFTGPGANDGAAVGLLVKPSQSPIDPTATPVEPTFTPIPPTATPIAPTPVPPTATPMEPTLTPVPPTATPVPPTATPMEPTLTPVPPTATPVEPTFTPVPPTATPMEPTLTPVPPTATPVEPTFTPVPPTATPMEPTATPMEPTVTPIPPTATSLPPTATPVGSTATPTATPIPPTATPVFRMWVFLPLITR